MLGSQMINVGVGWYVYAATHSPMSLAFLGLAEFLPNVAIVLLAGHVADRFDRQKILRCCMFVYAVCSVLFAVLAMNPTPHVVPVYVLLVIFGSARAFVFPAMSAILPQLVEGKDFPRAVATSASAMQIASLIGPAIGGVIYAISAPVMFATAALLYLIAMALTTALKSKHGSPAGEDVDKSVLGGIRYIRSNRLLFATISLDLFAVLLGGLTALLPIYAKDILAVGPAGLGYLRCASGIGAAIVSFFLAHHTIERNAGKTMLACVTGFGLATIIFALSKNFWLSFAALTVLGGFDVVSVVIRQTLVQIATPNAMRGRVSAVNGLFIGASNDLGEFESGVTAALFGTVPAAVLGGVGTLAVVALWAKMFPELRRADKLVIAEKHSV
jgi:MFS family permease